MESHRDGVWVLGVLLELFWRFAAAAANLRGEADAGRGLARVGGGSKWGIGAAACDDRRPVWRWRWRSSVRILERRTSRVCVEAAREVIVRVCKISVLFERSSVSTGCEAELSNRMEVFVMISIGRAAVGADVSEDVCSDGTLR